jgi:hypothetical protein
MTLIASVAPVAYTAGVKSYRKKPALTARIEPDGQIIKFTGRVAWMLRQLVKAGPRGLTTLDLPPGVRVSHHVMMLRRAGLLIESPREPHGGEWAGVHSRYTLRTQVTILEDCDA